MKRRLMARWHHSRLYDRWYRTRWWSWWHQRYCKRCRLMRDVLQKAKSATQERSTR